MMMKAKTEKMTKFTAKYLDKLIEEATTGAYDESEQAGGFFAMIEENLSLPFVTRVLGQEVTVGKVSCLQTLGFSRCEAKLQEEVRFRLRHMADFGVDLHFCTFLALTTAR